MKKIISLHVFLIAVAVLTFIALMLFASKSNAATSKPGTYAARQELKKVRRAVNAQLEKNRKAEVQARRQRSLYKGNINNFYPRAFKVRWIIINNRAHLMFSHYRPYYGYYNRYMRIS